MDESLPADERIGNEVPSCIIPEIVACMQPHYMQAPLYASPTICKIVICMQRCLDAEL